MGFARQVYSSFFCFVKLHFYSSSFKIFPSSKIDFWPFLKWQKMDFSQKKFFFREIALFDFTIFLAWTFFNFLSHCVVLRPLWRSLCNQFFFIIFDTLRCDIHVTFLPSGRPRPCRVLCFCFC